MNYLKQEYSYIYYVGLDYLFLQETRDEIKRIYRKSQLDLCHQY